MNILIIGGGAREHAITEAIHRSQDTTIYAVMNNLNPGIATHTKDYQLTKETNIENVLQFAVDKKIDLACIGPEAPLEQGLTDHLQKNGITVCGPTQKAAQIETNKAWMRNLLTKHHIPGQLKYQIFSTVEDTTDFIKELNENIAIKPLGLTGGKGVQVSGDHFNGIQEAQTYIKQIIQKHIGGTPQVLIEEKAIGEEFTLQALSDGTTILPYPAVQDHKRLLPNDEGPNTGGMGSYSNADHLLPFLTQDEYQEGVHILQQIIHALNKEGCPYIGPIYGQFMLTQHGIKIIEINARYGDPEAMNVLPLLQTDYLTLCQAAIDQQLSEHTIRFQPHATVCKYIVPEGYGYQSKSNQPITVNEPQLTQTGAHLYYASVNQQNNTIYTTTSRSLAVVGIATTIPEAEHITEQALQHIHSDHIFIRHDIGTEQLIQQRIHHIQQLRAIA